MAKIVEYRQQIEPVLAPASRVRPIDVSGGGEVESASLSQLGAGARNIAYALREKREEEARAWAAQALSEARLKWTTHLIERQSKAEPGANGFTPSFISDFDAYADETVSKAPSETARRYLTERLSDLRADLGAKAMVFEAQARIDWRDDQFKIAADNVAKLMNTDPGQYQTALAELLATIDASDMPPLKKSMRKEETVNRVSAAAVWSQIQRSPTEFLKSIGFVGGETGPDGKIRKWSGDLKGRTNNLAFDALPFDQRIKMFEAAIRVKAQMDADAERATKERQRQVAEEAMKEAWSRWDKGKLTTDYIESIRPLLSDNDYKALLVARRTPPHEQGQKTDPNTFRDILMMMDRDPAGAREAAYRAHRNGLLSNSDLNNLRNESQTLERQGGPRTQYERDRLWIRDRLMPGGLVDDPVGRARAADALQMFDDWRKKNPTADDATVRKRAEEIVDQFKFLDLSQTILALPTPRGAMIRRNPADKKGIMDDIRQAGNKLKNDFMSGKLTQQEYEAEMELLNRWRRAVENSNR